MGGTVENCGAAQSRGGQVAAMDEGKVRIAGTCYLVTLHGKHHFVSQSRRCSCGQSCEAVRLVAQYLRTGGRRAPMGIPLPLLTVPKQCPICGAEARPAPQLDTKRCRGWWCAEDPSHFWHVRLEPLRRWLKQNRWNVRKAA